MREEAGTPLEAWTTMGVGAGVGEFGGEKEGDLVARTMVALVVVGVDDVGVQRWLLLEAG